jgi:2-polyprenyl-3-methyl-5-hydroxy-6-metoxy-1,4-benzoquinol methylase
MIENKESECQLCGQISVLTHNAFPGYQEGMIFQIYFCPNCQTSFSLPRVETNKIYEVIYNKGISVPGYDRYWEYFQKVKHLSHPLQYLTKTEVSYWGILEALKQVVKNKQTDKILEIGCGLGYLSHSLRTENYNVLGLDISQKAIDSANANFGNYYICQDIYDYAKTNVNSFEVVILTEVIEHIEAPINFLEAILKVLKPNGRIILTTPNKSFFPADIIWDTDLPPVHCWWFSEESIKYMAATLKLNTSFINFSKYYRKNYKFHDLRRSRSLPTSVFDTSWELTQKNKSKKKSKKIKTLYQSIIFSIPFVKMLYIKSKSHYNSNYILCSEKGMNLCVILKK